MFKFAVGRTTRRLSIATLSMSVVLAFAIPADAQQAYQPFQGPGTPPYLQRVDPMISDVSPLGNSLRAMNLQADLANPTGFQHVYRVPGRDDLLMRANGGMYAIFPQSVYVPTNAGMAALVPPGTIFSIGMPGPWTLSSRWSKGPDLQRQDGTLSTTPTVAAANERYLWSGVTPVLNRLDSRRDDIVSQRDRSAEGAPAAVTSAAIESLPLHEIARATPPDPSTFLKTVVTDDQFRAQRLAALLQQALEATQRADG